VTKALAEAIRVLSPSGRDRRQQPEPWERRTALLCLRLGLAETFAERSEALPLILDDVLVNFDPGRRIGRGGARRDR